MSQILYIALGGATGAVVRYGMAGFVQALFRGRVGEAFPYGTMFVNITGCLLIGLLTPFLLERNPAIRVAILIGFLGAYTTWSTFSYETLRFINDGDFRHALLYAVFTNLGCFVAVWIGYRLMQHWLIGASR